MRQMTSESDRATLDRYVTHAKKHPLLTRKDELVLARRFAATGDRAAREALVLANLRFVLKVANKYRGYGFPLWELVQEGNVGLLLAIERFDPERGHRFLSYAVWWIRERILSYVQRSVSIVRGSSSRSSRVSFFNARKARQRLEANMQRAVSAAEIALEIGVNAEDVMAAERAIGGDMSADAGFIERVGSGALDPEQWVAEAEDRVAEHAKLAKALRGLNARELKVIEARHLREEPVTLADVGNDLHVSRERARQIEACALQKLHAVLHEAA